MPNNENNGWGELNDDNTAGINPNSVNEFIKSSKKEEAAQIGRKIEEEEREAVRKKARRVQWTNSVKNRNKPTLTTTRKQGSKIFSTDENAIAHMSSPSKVAFRNAMRQARLERDEQQNKKGGSYRRKKATRKNRRC